jgi:hypothetical protein
MQEKSKKQKVKDILVYALRYPWEVRDNAHTAGVMVNAWADEIVGIFEKEEPTKNDGAIHLTRYMTERCVNHKHASKKPKEQYVQCKKCGWYVPSKVK